MHSNISAPPTFCPTSIYKRCACDHKKHLRVQYIKGVGMRCISGCFVLVFSARICVDLGSDKLIYNVIKINEKIVSMSVVWRVHRVITCSHKVIHQIL